MSRSYEHIALGITKLNQKYVVVLALHWANWQC